MKDVFAEREEVCVSHMAKILRISREHCADWRLDEEHLAEMEKQFAYYEGVFKKCQDLAQRTPVLVTLKKRLGADFKREMRLFIRLLQANRHMTDEMRRELGITIPMTRRKKAECPSCAEGVSQD
jgi:hypothetical protein